ncbi:hypothetical protein DL763_000427 [Monosporascus cannonballus]|nr:hypothetical protein DL763_000427 [Monosporascus cannonballus]
MESSPLIRAHDHARAASTATHTADTTVAINEHTRAAGEFANAAKNTNSVEALRTLRLLEQHHQRLSELLQLPFKRPAQDANENESQSEEKEDAPAVTVTPAATSSKSDPQSASSAEKSPQPMPTLARQPRYPSRDLGASIASNLASARGIRAKYRGQPLSPSISNTEAPGNVEAGSRKSGSRSKMQNMLDHSEKSSPVGTPEKLSRQNSAVSQGSTPASPAPPSDEGFSRFYSAFGNIINRISAPLAFAGLPLISEEQSQEPTPAPAPEPSGPKRIRLRPTPSVTAEPDISKIYSKATLRAISRDGQSAVDSFYVVPTSGHTASYASILTYADKEKRRSEASSAHSDRGRIAEEADEDDFVDAKETQQLPPHPTSPGLRRRAGKAQSQAHTAELAHVVEELYLENKSLKDALDKLSKRLHAFESMSQNSGMRLAESMRLMRPGSPASSTSAGGSRPAGTGDDAAQLARRNRELEEQLLLVSRQMGEMERDYNKARANLARYRERWEQLKAGAKARRTGNQGASSETVDEVIRSPSLT